MIEYDFEGEALGLLLPQFRNSSNIKGLIKSYVSPCKDILDTTNSMMEAFNINIAEGEQLDYLGILLNVTRDGREDDSYRDAIKARIVVNNATGSGANLIKMLKLVLGDIPFTIAESFPASVQVIIYEAQSVVDENLVNDLVPVGVKGVFFGNPYEDKTLLVLGEVQPGGSVVGGVGLPDVNDIATSNVVMADVIYS